MILAAASVAAPCAGDVLFLKDGTRLSAKVRSCDEEVCVTDRRRIPTDQIARIELRAGKGAPSTIKGIGAVMTDGTIHAGRFTGLTLGYVSIGDEELERGDVAVIVVDDSAALPDGRAAPRDVLITNDDVVRTGTLTKCNAASCTFDGKIVPLKGVRWIGLGQEGSSPPQAEDTADIIFRKEQSVSARLAGVDATRVRSTRGNFSRDDVRWIHLAPPLEDEPPAGAILIPDPEPPPPPPPPPRKPRGGSASDKGPDKTSPPPGAGTGGSSKTPPPPPRLYVESASGALWTGTIKAHLWGKDGSSFDLKIDQRVRLREFTYTYRIMEKGKLKTIGSLTQLRSEGSTLHNKSHNLLYSASGVFAADCKADGTITITTDKSSPRDTTQSSVILHRVTDDPIPTFGEAPVPKGQSLYHIKVGAPGYHEETCQSSQRAVTNQRAYFAVPLGRLRKNHPVPVVYDDPKWRYVEAGKMIGSYEIPVTRMWQHMTASWAICREGVQCPEPQLSDGPQENKGPGGRTPVAGDDDDCLTLARLIDGMNALREAYEAHEASFVEAKKKRDQARDSIFGFSGSLAKFFVSLASLASEGHPGKFGDNVGLIGAAAALAQDPSGDNVAQAVIELAGTEAAFSPAAKQGVLEAIRKADAVLDATGSDSSALRTYANELGKSGPAIAKGQNIVKGISVVVSADDFGDNTQALADSIQGYLDKRSEAKSHEANMQETQDLMAQKQDEIDEARAALDGPCPGIPSTGNVPSRNSTTQVSSPYQLVQSTADAGELPASAEEVRNIAAAVSGVEAKMANAVPWLLPFFARVTDGVSPRMLAALLRRAEPDLRAVKTDIEAASRAGRDLERRFGKPSPGTAAE